MASHKPPHEIPFKDRLTCTIAEAIQVSGLGRSTINRLIGSGRLASVKLDGVRVADTDRGRRLVRVPSLLALLGEGAP